MRVLHVLERSAPELVGYTVRGGYILKHQRRSGLDPLVVTSPFFVGANGEATDDIDGIRHYRSNHIPPPTKAQPRIAAYWTRMQMVRRYREFVTDVARRAKPDVIHAHSSYMNGMAARYAAERLGIPFVYELRGLWADTAVVEDGLRPGSMKYRAFWKLELDVVRRADMVVAISSGIRDAIVERGIDANKIAIVPNGVDTDVFAPRRVDASLKESLGLAGCFVVGFIGSVRRLEGIELVVSAFKDVQRREPRARLLIVGDGPERQRLEAMAADAGLGDVIRFTGLVPHDDVLRYYSVMDMLVYPRIDAPINQAVTPLKPLEAMAMGKVCLASDVGGLKELVEDQVTGVLFAAGDRQDLTKKILLLSSDARLRDRLSAQAQTTVRREREWSALSARYDDIYRRAGAVPGQSRDHKLSEDMSATKRDVIRIGIVGAGYVSAYHLRALQSLDGVTVVGIADTDQAKARHVAEEFRIPAVCASLDDLMALKPHVVHILTPPSLHRDLSIRAMRMGADVFVEKPMAESAEDCDLMIAAARETGRVLSVNHSARMDPVVLRALELVRSGSIGDVLAVHFFRNSDYAPYAGGDLPAPYRRGGYPFEDLGVHGLYLMEAFLGSITDVDVRYRSTGRDPNLFFDEWHASIEAEKGTGHMYISWNSRPMQNELIVHGTRGMISVDCYLQRLSVQTTLPAPKPVQRMLGTAMAAAGTLYGVPMNAVKFVTGRLKPNAGIHTSVRKFYDALAAGAPPPVSAEEGRRAVRWMESAVREADRRKVEALAPAPASQPARVLVTGASGLLGGALLRRLRSHGVVARVLLRRPSPALAAEPDVEVMYGDLGDPSAVDRAMRDIDIVYHVGSAMSGGKAAFEAGTVAATRNVVAACVRHSVRRLVHVSSIILLDHAGHARGTPIDETHPLEPRPQLRGFYTQAKLEAEQIVLDAVRREGLPAVIVRPGQLVGPGVEKFAPAGTIAFGGRWVVVGDGTMRLAAVHIEDAVDALLLAAERQVCGQIFHVVDTVNVLTQNGYIDACREVVGPKLRVARVPAPVLTGAALMASVASRVTGVKLPLSLYRLRSSAPIGPFDCRAAREKLGWTPNVGTAVGLAAVVDAEPAGVGAGGTYAFARGNGNGS